MEESGRISTESRLPEKCKDNFTIAG